MVVEASVGFIGYFMPIFAFLLVFIVVYALLKKTGAIGDSEPVLLFISLILASFFIVEASLVEFVQFTSAWVVTIIVIVFFILAILAFMPGKEPLKFLSEATWFSWTLLILMIAFFIISSAHIFNWAVNWDRLHSWVYADWFGMILLIVIAGVVAFTIKGKAK